MCDNESDSKHEVGKERKIDSHAEQNQNENLNESEIQSGNSNQSQLAGPSNEEIFKMDIDSFEELFDYLSVYDLLALRLTSKRFKKIIDYFIRTNYPRLRKFRVSIKNAKMFRKMDADTIEWINKMYVILTDYFDYTKFPFIQKSLNKVEKIEICVWKTDPDFYNCFLKYCKNVKCLSLKRYDRYSSYIDISYEWLSRHYPLIEYFRIDFILKGEVDVYVKFFRLNPNIHAFSIKLDYLNEIGSRLIEAGIKFDRLYIDDTNQWSTSENGVVILESLYHAGFYKRLCLTTHYIKPNNEGTQSKFASIGMEVLNVESLNFTIPPISSLKELNVDSLCVFNEKYKNVRNTLERFSCDITYSNDILAFIGYFPKLKHFQIQKMNDTDKLDLFELNKERENLAGACKTKVYINEKVYLATKWAKMQTNYKLIELKRVHACDWDRFFENDCGMCGH